MDRPSIVFTSLCILLISSISSAANRLSRNSPSVRKITQGPVLAQSDFPELSSEDIPIINVHLIAHSHQDAGWLKTDDEYFWGTKRNVVQGNSRLIHDSVFDELLKDENRKFSFAEIRFFRDWYMHRLDNEMCRSTHSSVSLNFASRGEILLKNSHDSSCTFASQFERLISRNQIEFVNGGWVSNDEATTSFIDILDQYTLGSKFLLQTFGERALAKTGWQIDPFGHSLFQAQAFRKMGFDSYFIGRADAQEIALREYRGELETLTGDGADFIMVSYTDLYQAPPGLHVDIHLSDDTIVDDTSSGAYNLDRKMADFYSFVVERALTFYGGRPRSEKQNSRSSAGKPVSTQPWNVLLTMGSDFAYEQAELWFHMMDQLIHHSKQSPLQNSEGKSYYINVFYSTPSLYTQSKDTETTGGGYTWPIKSDDWFPYVDDGCKIKNNVVDCEHNLHAYWAGFYSSRSNLKKLVRDVSVRYTVFRQLRTLSVLRCYSNENVNSSGTTVCDLNIDKDIQDQLAEVSALLQHHDAVTGTSRRAVVAHYTGRAKIILQQSRAPIERYFHTAFPDNTFLLEDELIQYFSVYNPSSYILDVLITVSLPNHLSGGTFSLLNSVNEIVTSSVITSLQSFLGNKEKNELSLVFIAHIPPMYYSTYSLVNSDSGVKSHKFKEDGKSGTPVKINTSFGFIEYDSDGVLKIHNNNDPASADPLLLEIDFAYYIGAQHNKPERTLQASGVYIFRPDCDEGNVAPCRPISLNLRYDGYSHDSGIWILEYSSVHTDENSPNRVSCRLFIQESNTLSHADPMLDIRMDYKLSNMTKGVETVFLLNTNIVNSGVFFTDSNGRQWMRRALNSSPYSMDSSTFGLSSLIMDPVAMNYYPITTAIAIAGILSNGVVDPNPPLEETVNRAVAKSLTVVPDRSHGGSSLKEGQMELMIHRTSLMDDDRGVSEPLDEEEVSLSGSMGILLNSLQIFDDEGDTDSLRLIETIRYRRAVSSVLMPPQVFKHESSDLLTLKLSDKKQLQTGTNNENTLQHIINPESLENIDIITLEIIPHGDKRVDVFQKFTESNEELRIDSAMLQSSYLYILLRLSNKRTREIVYDISTLFPNLDGAIEMTWNAVTIMEVSEKSRIKWKTVQSGVTDHTLSEIDDLGKISSLFKFEHLELKTFVVRISVNPDSQKEIREYTYKAFM